MKDTWKMWKSWVEDYLIYQTSMQNRGSSLGEATQLWIDNKYNFKFEKKKNGTDMEH